LERGRGSRPWSPGTVLFAPLSNAGSEPGRGHKRQAVTKLLNDDEWAAWSDREIARQCHVDHVFVGRVRALLKPVTGDVTSEDRTYRTKHGTTSTMNTAAIGKQSRQPEDARAYAPARHRNGGFSCGSTPR
jgi:hypothetical protein